MWPLLLACHPDPPAEDAVSPAHRVWRGDDERDWAGFDLDLAESPHPWPVFSFTPTQVLESVSVDIRAA